MDAKKDPWSNEALTELASAHIGKLLQVLAVEPTAEGTNVSLSTKFSCASLCPESPAQIYRHANIEVYSASEPQTPHCKDSAQASFSAGLQSLRQRWQGGEIHQHAFKITSLQRQNDTLTTAVHIDLSGQRLQDRFQISAEWVLHWNMPGTHLALDSITWHHYDEVWQLHSKSPWYSEQTQTVLGANDSYHAQLMWGLDHWRDRLDSRLGIEIDGYQGIAR
ncbi:MAG: hypothetical protein R3C68_07970 [Myxococcota bacterium]